MNVFEFHEFILDANTVRLLKKGQPVEIEPQLFETLLLLIKNNHRVVTKDELLQEVWNDRLVTDSVITRTIYEIRKIIDTSESKNSMIRTVRGTGYQFIADIKPVDSCQTDVTHTSRPRKHSVEESKPKSGGLKKSLIGLFLSLLVVVLWLGFQNKQNKEVQLTNTKAEAYPVVTVLPIRFEGGSEELAVLTQSIVDYLTNQLTLNLRMKVIHPDHMTMLQDQFSDIWSIQKATRATFLLQGFLESVSDKVIKLHLTLYKKNESNELTPYSLGSFEFPYPHTSKDLNDLYKQRKSTVREIISLIKPGVIVSESKGVETNDPEAYRMVIAAHHMSRNDDCGNIQRVEQLLLSAVERDNEFAYAYYQLFALYFKRVWLCGDSIEYHQKALAMAEIVERLAPNTYRPMYKGINAILIESNQVEKAYELSENADWNDPDILNHKVYGLRYAGFLQLASQHIDRILQLDPYFYSKKPIHQAPNTLFYLNRFEDHLKLLAEPGNAYHDYYRSLSLMLNNLISESKQLLQATVRRTPDDLFGQFSSALLNILNDQSDQAKKIIDALVNKRQEKNLTDGEMTYKIAQLYALAGDLPKALSQLQLAVDQGFFPVSYFKTDPALVAIQNEQTFNQIIEQAKSRHLAFARRFNLTPEVN